MFILATLAACGGKQAEPEAPAEPSAEPAVEEPAVEEPVEAEPTAGAAAADCPEGAVIYHQLNAPLRAPDDTAMHWTLVVHDSGYWANTAPNGTTTGCLGEEDLTNVHAALAEADVTAPPLEPGMARCMAMPMTQFTVTIGDKTASWTGPCGPSNPSASLDSLIKTVSGVSYDRE